MGQLFVRFSSSTASIKPVRGELPGGFAHSASAADGGTHLVARARRRISIALVAMAVVPLLVVSLLPSLWTTTSRGQEETRLDAAGQSLAATLSIQLDAANGAIAHLAAAPAVVAVAAGKASDAQLAAARTALQMAATTLPGGVGQITLVDRAGVARLTTSAASAASATSSGEIAGSATPPATSAGSATTSGESAASGTSTASVAPGAAPSAPGTAGTPSSAQAAELTVPITADSGKETIGSLRAQLHLTALLATAPIPAGDGSYALIVDARTGRVLADSREAAMGAPGAFGTAAGTAVTRSSPSVPFLPEVASAAGSTLAQSRQAWERFLGGSWDVGVALVGAKASDTAGWSVVVVGPSPALPLVPIVLAALLLALLVALGVWLARRALRPAEELEASRAQLVSLYESARVDALFDALTGLGNHRAFQEEVDRQVEASLRYGPHVALLLVDLDEFKSVNDSSGHAAGDELLAQMGHLIQSTIRRVDRAFRVGGDEFAILMPHTDAEGAESLARRLLARALSPGAAGEDRPFSFSAGISVAPTLAKSRDELYAQADAALYWCKRHGRTMIEVYDRERIGDVVDEHVSAEMSAAIGRLAANRLMRAVFQPVVELATGQVVGLEGLVRPMRDSGFANAGDLFAAAHAAGRTIELDRACLEVVVATAASLPKDRMITLNLSPRTLEAPEFNAAWVHNLLLRHGITPGRVVIELTEREDVEDIERLRRSVEACRALGIRVAADDVGSGNAGLKLLSQLHFDIVKIDLSLVQDGVTQESATAVLRTLADLARRWGALVIAEGIETPEQLRLVRELGLNGGQGYLLARPSDTPRLEPLDLDELAGGEDWLHQMARVKAWPAPTAG